MGNLSRGHRREFINKIMNFNLEFEIGERERERERGSSWGEGEGFLKFVKFEKYKAKQKDGPNDLVYSFSLKLNWVFFKFL